MLNQQQYTEVIKRILKNGIKQFNNKNILPLSKSTDKQGVVAGFTSKNNMAKTEGIIFRSMDKLLENGESLTHWTPNVYSWLGGGKGRSIWGHNEQNLIQINTFVADIDYPVNETKTDMNTLLLYLLEEGLLPTLILDTPKGYHVYFFVQNYNVNNDLFDKPSYISNANDYKSLKVAKRISENIRFAIKKRLPQVDMGCNHFGIFRFPTQKNIVHYEPNFVNTFEGYLKWSQEFEAKEKAEKKSKLKVLGNAKVEKGFRQIDSKWFDFLIHTDIQEGDRNTTIFTLALACKSSGLSFAECIDVIDQISFTNDLSDREVKRTIKSAYEGDYKGAKATYINDIISSYATPSQYELYAVKDDSMPQKSGKVDSSRWVKFAKPREERKYSHFDESQADLLAYLESKQKELNESENYLTIGMAELSTATGIPLSSLKLILKQLKQKGLIILKTQRGRNGKTQIATQKYVQTRVLMAVIAQKRASKAFAVELLTKEEQRMIEAIITKYANKTVPFTVNKKEYTLRHSKQENTG